MTTCAGCGTAFFAEPTPAEVAGGSWRCDACKPDPAVAAVHTITSEALRSVGDALRQRSGGVELAAVLAALGNRARNADGSTDWGATLQRAAELARDAKR